MTIIIILVYKALQFFFACTIVSIKAMHHQCLIEVCIGIRTFSGWLKCSVLVVLHCTYKWTLSLSIGHSRSVLSLRQKHIHIYKFSDRSCAHVRYDYMIVVVYTAHVAYIIQWNLDIMVPLRQYFLTVIQRFLIMQWFCNVLRPFGTSLLTGIDQKFGLYRWQLPQVPLYK